jgi:hypothetical protein
MSVKAERDIEYVEGEVSGVEDPYLIAIKEKDGTAAVISWADEIELIVTTKDFATTRFNAKLSDDGLSVIGNVVVWHMAAEQTTGYSGEHVAQVICTRESDSRKRKTYLMSVMVYPKTDEEPAP